MYLAPFPDFLEGVFALFSGVIFQIVAIINFPIIILLEASLLRRLIPGIRAFLFSCVINVITFLLGVGAASLSITPFGDLLSDPLQGLYDGLPDWAWFPLVYFVSLGLSVLIEGGVLKVLAAEVPSARIWRASLIINIASYVLLGITAGVVGWGYEYQDSMAGFISLVYILTQCGVPLISIMILVGLVIENLISAQLAKKPKPAEQEVVGADVSAAVETPVEEKKVQPRPHRQGEVERGGFGCGSYVSWILVTAVGVAIGFGESGVVFSKLESMGAVTWSIMLLGVAIGALQWLLLRRHISRAGWWILATIGGWACALAIAALLSVFIRDRLTDWVESQNWIALLLLVLPVGILLGSVSGALQSLILRRQTQFSGQWILFSTIGWGLGLIVALVVGVGAYHLAQEYSIRAAEFAAEPISPMALIAWPLVLAGAVGGGTAGTITGSVLFRLLERSYGDGQELNSLPEKSTEQGPLGGEDRGPESS